MNKILTIAAVSAVACSAVHATQLFTGRLDGVNQFTYENVSSGPTAWQDYSEGDWISSGGNAVAGMISDGNNGTHVLQANGLAHYAWNGAAMTTGSGFAGIAGGTVIASAPDGTIYTAKGDGINAWTHDGSTYTEVGFYGATGVTDLAVDASGYLHVIKADGMSAFSFDGSTISAIGGAFTGFGDGLSMVIDGSGNIFTGRATGMNAFSFDGSTYTENGWKAEGGGMADLAVTSDGTVFSLRANGWDLEAHTFDGSAFTQTGWLGGVGDPDGSLQTVFIDSEDNIHMAKGNGILEVNYAVVGGDVDANLLLGDWNGTGGVTSFAEVIPEPGTLGLFALIGGGMLWARKRFLI